MVDLDVSDKEKYEFNATWGWWLQKVLGKLTVVSRTVPGVTASADIGSATCYPTEFRQVIDQCSYDLWQVFNADKAALYWKEIPDRTYIAKEDAKISGFQVEKDHVSLRFCAKATGDC